MKTITYQSWNGFHKFLRDYSGLERSRRQSLLFRGHADAGWELETTLDRHRKFSDDAERAEYYGRLLSEFQLEGLRLSTGFDLTIKDDAFEFLARHHGIPSPILDWSSTPYVSA